MSTLSAIRSRKELANSLAYLPPCRALLYLLAMPLFAQAGQSTTLPAAACQAAGQIARWDIVEQRESLFGTVKALDQANYRITVRVSASSHVSVDAAGSVAFLDTADRCG